MFAERGRQFVPLWRRIWYRARRIGAATATRRRSRAMRGLAVSLPFALAACQTAVIDSRGAVGIADKTILIDSLVIILAIVIPTIVATLGFAWWFRSSNRRAARLPDWAYSGRIELIVWSIPLLVIILLGGVAWIGSHDLDPAEPLASDKQPLDVQIVSLDWKWLFIYPRQDVASVNQLVIPDGTPIRFSLTSASVMNAFFVPQLASMIYTMNGMTTKLNLMADEPGVFAGLSSHFSGDGFSGMHFDVRAIPEDQFSAWIEAARRSGPALDTAGYEALEKQGTNVEPSTFRLVDSKLFERIATQELPAAPGAQQPGMPK